MPLESDESIRATLDSDGMLIAFYYTRNTVSYTVEYVEYNTNNVITSKTLSALFGETVEEMPLDLTAEGYSCISGGVRRLTLKESGNVIRFSYQENSVSYKYITIMGGVTSDVYPSETLGARTGVANGWLPIASKDYNFAGWFKDEACTIPVDPAVDPVDPVTFSNDGKLVPLATDANGDGVYLYEGGTYYAKFDFNFTSLTISVENSLDNEQGFLFLLEGIDANTTGVNLLVAVKGNGVAVIDMLTVGKYRVTQLDGWSWRYSPDSPSLEINLSEIVCFSPAFRASSSLSFS